MAGCSAARDCMPGCFRAPGLATPTFHNQAMVTRALVAFLVLLATFGASSPGAALTPRVAICGRVASFPTRRHQLSESCSLGRRSRGACPWAAKSHRLGRRSAPGGMRSRTKTLGRGPKRDCRFVTADLSVDACRVAAEHEYERRSPNAIARYHRDGRARRGASGALYPQSAPAGLNPLPRSGIADPAGARRR